MTYWAMRAGAAGGGVGPSVDGTGLDLSGNAPRPSFRTHSYHFPVLFFLALGKALMGSSALHRSASGSE